MSTPDYRLDGIYLQRQDGYFMQRVKLQAGVISARQAQAVAEISQSFGRGTVHLTSRGSMEIHWLKEQDLPRVKRELAKAGLTSRGACGGAVRGITCGSQGAHGFPHLESLARRLHRHFTGNPRFERLPKKFKIGVEAGVVGGRHLIQDVGIVLSGFNGGQGQYDVWIAGGLGREPRPAFLLAQEVPEARIIPMIEAVLRVYATHAPPPKRLKFLAAEFGEDKLRSLIEAEPSYREELPEFKGFSEEIAEHAADRPRLTLPVFAGVLQSDQLAAIAGYAEQNADGILLVTPDQDIELVLTEGIPVDGAVRELKEASGLDGGKSATVFRVCPGNHECRMGLIATRDVAKEILSHLDEQGSRLTWALSGCPNSCTQPQLAEAGIVCSSLPKDEQGQRFPRFDLYRRSGNGLGEVVERSLTLDELCSRVRAIA